MGQTVKLTNRRVLELYRGLNSLDGIRVGKDELVPFVFDSATKWALVSNAIAVESAKEKFDRYEREQAKTLGIHDGMTLNEANSAKVAAYKEAIETGKDIEVDFSDLTTVSRSALLNQPLDPSDKKVIPRTNQIPLSVLKMIAPIIQENE